MKKALIAMIVSSAIAALSGCASLNEAMGLPVNKGNGYLITQDKKNHGGSVTIEYRDKTLLESETRAEMSNRMASESETLDKISRLPDGGRIFINYEQLTIEAANTKWLEYVVLKDGVEVFRRKGSNSIAKVPKSSSSANRRWWNIDVLGIPKPLGKTFQLIVINNLENKRDTFTISAP